MEIARCFYNSLTTFEINNENYTEVQSSYEYKFVLPFERYQLTPIITRFLQNYWQHTVTVSVLYFMMVKSIERFLHNRPPFNLRLPLIIWNLSLALFSIVGFVRFGEDYFESLFNRGIYTTICTNPPHDGVAALWCAVFVFSKLFELGDTLFIVLRKRPLIFLHYYHHVAVLIYAAHSGAEHATPGRSFIAMNFAAHSLMYSYYAARAMGYRPPEFISVTITLCQTIQMIVGVAISIGTYYIKAALGWQCQQSFANLYLGFFIYFTFAFLFIKFFVNRYLKSEKDERKMEKEKKKE
ncbi:hypothetical protein PFISCL1PPCAC_14738 [Pristionchus fissidentatus]|uniref:Elongation of very long chain fatty acids protein n=1 Tax=Pristionchus fissidentatus TaxID=1538716 RepID=A0AAV5VVA4_9BILA|nr:hypothetical protein PFISCL1PPCAC_14738 [Pristionchus fissidentatus]